MIDFARNQFDGTFDVSAQSGAVTQIKLDYNRLNGVVPDLSAIKALTSFSIKGNAFTGQIDGLAGVTNLEKL